MRMGTNDILRVLAIVFGTAASKPPTFMSMIGRQSAPGLLHSTKPDCPGAAPNIETTWKAEKSFIQKAIKKLDRRGAHVDHKILGSLANYSTNNKTNKRILALPLTSSCKSFHCSFLSGGCWREILLNIVDINISTFSEKFAPMFLLDLQGNCTAILFMVLLLSCVVVCEIFHFFRLQ